MWRRLDRLARLWITENVARDENGNIACLRANIAVLSDKLHHLTFITAQHVHGSQEAGTKHTTAPSTLKSTVSGTPDAHQHLAVRNLVGQVETLAAEVASVSAVSRSLASLRNGTETEMWVNGSVFRSSGDGLRAAIEEVLEAP